MDATDWMFWLGLAAAVGLATAAWRRFGPGAHRWRAVRAALRERLLRAGGPAASDLAEADAFVRLVPLPPDRGRPFHAFVKIEGRALRVLSDEPFVAEGYRAEPDAACGDCGRCAAAWACGGRDLVLALRVGNGERRYRARALGGRGLGAAARAQAEFMRALSEDGADGDGDAVSPGA